MKGLADSILILLQRAAATCTRMSPCSATPNRPLNAPARPLPAPQGHFPGTLFRLPLRTAVAAAASDIKQSPFTPDDGWALLGALAQELPCALLFLKSVTCAGSRGPGPAGRRDGCAALPASH